MWNVPMQESLFKKFGKYARIAGVIFVLLGIAGIAFPPFMTMATVVFVSWLLLFGGISAAFFTWQTDRSDWMGWLKSFASILVALYMLFLPLAVPRRLGCCSPSTSLPMLSPVLGWVATMQVKGRNGSGISMGCSLGLGRHAAWLAV